MFLFFLSLESLDVFDIIITMQVMNLIGDVKGKVAVMVDDMIDTAGEIFVPLVFLYVLLFHLKVV